MLKLNDVLAKDSIININNIRKKNIPFILIWLFYYCWVIVYATWWTASPENNYVFIDDLRSILQSVLLISSAISIFIIKRESYKNILKYGSIIIVCGMIFYWIIPGSFLKITISIILAVVIGVVNTGVLIPYVFILNNTEKLYAVVFSNLLIHISVLLFELFSYYKKISFIQLIGSYLLLSIIIIVIFISIKNKTVMNFDKTDVKLNKRLYWILVFNCFIAILCKGVGKGVLNITAANFDIDLHAWYNIGGIIGCVVFFVLYAISKKSYVLLGNITFAGFALSLLFNSFVDNNISISIIFAVLLGISNAVGMINMYYILGVVGKKYNSMLYLKLSLLFIGICGGVAGVIIGKIITNINTLSISISASVFSAVVMVFFIIMAPVFSKEEFENDWPKDSMNVDVSVNGDILEKYLFSKREREVCELLLPGYTLRQISGILSIAYSTVNTYCTALYKKLSINSRTELLIMFKDYNKIK